MTWPLSSSDRAAAAALAGQFVTVRSLLSGIVLSATAVILALTTGVQVSLRPVGPPLVLVLFSGAALVSRTWINTSRWLVLRALPIRESSLRRQTIILAAGVMTLDGLLPVVLLTSLSGLGHNAGAVLLLVLFGAGVEVVSVLAQSATRAAVRHCLRGILLVSALLWAIRPALSAGLVLAAGTACLVSNCDMGRPPRAVHRIPAGAGILLGELLSNRTTLINAVGLVILSVFFTGTLLSYDVSLPLGLAVVAVNTPLNSYFSRHPSTLVVVTAAPGTGLTFARYFLGVCLFSTLSAAPAGILLVHGGQAPGSVLAELLSCTVASALCAGLLERYRPFTRWKSERDVFRHPRKYLPPAAGLMAMTAVTAIATG